MWSKIYLAVLGLSFAVVGFFNYYSWSWLQSIGQPAVAIEGYEYNRGVAWMALWLFVVTLLLIGNIILWHRQRAGAMWSTFVFFSISIVTRYFWLDQGFGLFEKDNGLTDPKFSLGPLLAVVWIAFMAVIVFLDQFVVLRLHRKMYPAEPALIVEPTSEPGQ